MITAKNRAALIDAVAVAIYETLFDDELPPEGYIERALYQQAASAALLAGAQFFEATGERERIS